MTEIFLPSVLRVARSSFKYLDQTGDSRGVFNGAVQTTGYGGDRVGASLDFTPHGGRTAAGKSERGQLLSFLASMRGKQNRVFLTDSSYTLQGSLPSTEVLAASDLSSTTGWSAGTDASIAASNNTIRVKRAANLTAGAAYLVASLSGLTANAPYAWRFGVVSVRGTTNVMANFGGTFFDVFADVGVNAGYHLRCGYSSGTTGTALVDNVGALVSLAGDSYDVTFASVSRCLVADGGANLLQRSDELGNVYYTPSNCTVTTNASIAPDSTINAEHLVESSSANVEHYITNATPLTVPAAAADYTLTCAARADGRDWVLLRLAEGTGNTYAFAWFNVQNGTLGSVSNGANWSNVRSSIDSMGNGWYQCSITARKTNAATALSAILQTANGNSVTSYAGSAATSAIRLWRATLSQSSYATRLRQAVSAAVAADLQAGSAIYVKGLPASTTDLLVYGAWVEIDGQMKMVTAPLDSNGIGTGYLQFSPPLRRAIADNTPIIACRPMGRFMLAGGASWNNVPGVFSDTSIELEEAWS